MRTALLVSLILALSACGLGAPPSAGLPSGASPNSVASGPRISAPPVTPPTAPGTNLPEFACANAAGGKPGTTPVGVTTARVAQEPGFERFVMQFDSAVPAYTVKRQATATFKGGASGQTLTLNGNAGVLVQVHLASGATTFTGSTDLQHPEFQVLVEARQTVDFEGYVSWGLGLSRAACLRTYTLPDPDRLVVDFQTTTS